MKNALLLFAFMLLGLGLTAQSVTEDLRIFPNPVSTTFQIGYSERVDKVSVINMVGREVRNFNYAADSSYNIGNLPRGMYLVQLTDNSGGVIHTQRVKKE